MPPETLVFIDIETTGLSIRHDKIIEIGAIKVKSGQIIDTYNSLINPGTILPREITSLTGIKTEDLFSAPKFEDIGRELLHFLGDSLFVAHNVRFDYGFIKSAFKRIDLAYKPRMICTMKLSKSLNPELSSHRLDLLISRHNIQYKTRHRALDDASIIYKLWRKFEKDYGEHRVSAEVALQFRHPSIPRHIPKQEITTLPEGPGVYIFRDNGNIPLYIGKSINIRKRVVSHFNRDMDESKEFKISQTIRHVDYIATTGELSALILEASMIKDLQPIYNRRLRRIKKLTITTSYLDSSGYRRFERRDYSMENLPEVNDVVSIHPRRSAAQQSLERAVKTFDLCPKLCGLEKSNGACFRYQLRKCKGACIGLESPESYNSRVRTVFRDKSVSEWNYSGPMVLSEINSTGSDYTSYVIDKWVIKSQSTHLGNKIIAKSYEYNFDLDSYLIITNYIRLHPDRVKFEPLNK